MCSFDFLQSVDGLIGLHNYYYFCWRCISVINCIFWYLYYVGQLLKKDFLSTVMMYVFKFYLCEFCILSTSTNVIKLTSHTCALRDCGLAARSCAPTRPWAARPP